MEVLFLRYPVLPEPLYDFHQVVSVEPVGICDEGDLHSHKDGGSEADGVLR